MFFRFNYILKNIFLTIAASTFVIASVWAQELEIPLITKVQVSPDQKQITIEADNILGNHSAFAFQNPYRLVIDFETTGLGKIPAKMKVDKPPINEIRLGKNDRRARLVIDFGEYPVPPFMVERKGKFAVVALGNVPTDPRTIHGNSTTEPPSKTYESQPLRLRQQTENRKPNSNIPAPAPVAAKQPIINQPHAEKKIENSRFVVKQALVTNSLLLVELQDKEFPTKTFRVVVDLNLNDLTIHNASISGSNGIIKKFNMNETDPKDSNPGPSVRDDDEPPPLVGPRRSVVQTEDPKKATQKLIWGDDNQSDHQVQNVSPGSSNPNPFKLQQFELKSKNSGSARLGD